MTVAELAKAAGVTPRTLHRLEIGGAIAVAPKLRHGHVSRTVLDRIVAALKQRGVELVHGAGARLARPRAERQGEAS